MSSAPWIARPRLPATASGWLRAGVLAAALLALVLLAWPPARSPAPRNRRPRSSAASRPHGRSQSSARASDCPLA